MKIRCLFSLAISFLFGPILSLQAFTPTENGIYATFETNMGNFTAVLYYDQAPMTVANFIGLAEGSRKWIDPRNAEVSNRPYYDGIIFHRVIADFMIQGGSPAGDGTDGPGYSFPDEIAEGLVHDSAGLLSMANSGPSTNGSQFFITVAPTPWLDGRHTIFGRIVDSYSNVEAISNVATGTNDRPQEPVRIERVSIIRQGSSAVAFDIHQQGLPSVESVAPQIRYQDNQMIAAIPMPPNSQSFIYQTKNFIQWDQISTNIFNTTQPNENFPLLDLTEPKTAYFYRFARIRYANEILAPVDLIGRTLILNLPYDGGVDVFRLEFTTDISGTGKLNEEEALGMDYYYIQGPYFSQFAFQVAGFIPLYPDLNFETSTSGTFQGTAGQNQFNISGTFQLE